MQKRIRSPINLSIAVAGAVLLFGVGYLGGRALDADRLWAEGDEVDGPANIAPGEDITPPPDDATPEPGSTPDTSQPFWYVPYENQERLKPHFSGEINGITVGVEEGPLPELECNADHVTGQAALDAVAGTFFDFHLDSLPGNLEPMVVTAEAMICDDASPSWFAIELTDGDGAAVRITRMQGVTWWREWGSEDRWGTGTVAGRKAVFKEQLLAGKLGEATVLVADPETDGSTRIKSFRSRWTLPYITSVAEELYR